MNRMKQQNKKPPLSVFETTLSYFLNLEFMINLRRSKIIPREENLPNLLPLIFPKWIKYPSTRLNYLRNSVWHSF
ncbi:hypothetical protein A8938_2328 [Algoriphagus zhangzhouensis]|uniref:Uncharacterized protein n=1 Tax=Algoriphagus zhangzhouensis TaxID=1073327 RepID=A0A1M7ZD23_9BACT|nr:hypothetical protein A8938_2328 [Algoriphagus zhangzhouensis]SHO62805.1 hypothetical protein SAMN04488108_2326 [Algoriphagus zhangzhouensis]